MMAEIWFKLFASEWFKFTDKMTDQEKGKYMDQAMLALLTRTRGKNKFANKMLDRLEESSKKQSERAKAGWRRAKEKEKGAMPRQCHGKTEEKREDREEMRKDCVSGAGGPSVPF
jgi:hypothetical protein